MDVDKIINNVKEFYLWIQSHTGLEYWQLLIVTLALLFLFSRLAIYFQKVRINKRMVRNSNNLNLIGSHLSNKNQDNTVQKMAGTIQTVYISEEDDEHQSWGQTTKDWRKLREKIRHLQHDISKHERLEKQLQEEIEELKKTNEMLKLEIDKRTKTEDTLQQQINELTNTAFIPNQTGQTIAENRNNTKFTDRQQPNPQTVNSSNNETIIADYLQSLSSEKPNNSLETTPKENFDPADTTEKEQNFPLNIKELKAIADLVKRLQNRSQQRQSE